jgi:hypothetical protein
MKTPLAAGFQVGLSSKSHATPLLQLKVTTLQQAI